MSEVKNATTEQIQELQQEINTEKTTIGIKTIWEHRNAFNEVPGSTNEEKYLNLLEAYNKQKKNEDSFVLDSQMEAITSALDTARKQVDSIESLVNQRKQTLKEVYIDDIGEKLKLVGQNIENEKVLNAEIITLRKELEDKDKAMELLEKRFQEKEMMVSEGKNKIVTLETENKVLITKNSELVHQENNYINQLREKDVEINSKTVEIDRLKNTHKEELEALKVSFKADLDKLQESYKVKIADLEKEKAIIENTVSSLEKNIEKYVSDNEKLNIDIEQLRKDSKEDVKQLETAHREQINEIVADRKVVEDRANKLELENAKIVSKLENAESNIKALQEERNEFKQEVKICSDNIKKLEKENMKLVNEKEKVVSSLDATIEKLQSVEKVVSDKDKEIERLKASKPKAKGKSSKENNENE